MKCHTITYNHKTKDVSIWKKEVKVYFQNQKSNCGTEYFSFNFAFDSYPPPPVPTVYPCSLLNKDKRNLIMKAAVCHSQHSLLANVHFNDLSVWYKSSVFYWSINPGTSLGLLSDIL